MMAASWREALVPPIEYENSCLIHCFGCPDDIPAQEALHRNSPDSGFWRPSTSLLNSLADGHYPTIDTLGFCPTSVPGHGWTTEIESADGHAAESPFGYNCKVYRVVET